MKAKQIMKKFLFYFTSIVIIIFLEILFSKFSVFGIFFIIFIGLYRGSYSGCTVGFFIGLIEGVFFATTFGALSFSYSIIGYLSGRLPKRIDEENPLAQISIIFFGVVISDSINIIIEVLFTGIPGIFSIIWLIIPVIISPVFFLIFKKWWMLWFNRLDVER
ncbi:MAG TPA: rod shape-determining protein MreD [Elusimicrobia bacterium]|nr:rod shape-determining protein MreD [Elusimicrobiota bacterium]